MITPEYLNEIMYSVEDKLSEVNEYLIMEIVKRIVSAFTNGDGKLVSPTTINEMRQLMRAGVLYEDIQKAVEKQMPGMEKVVRDAFCQASEEISRQNLDIAHKIVDAEGMASIVVPELEQIGITADASKLQMTKAEIKMLESAYRRTKGSMHNLVKTTASNAQKAYINACDKAYMKAQSGLSPEKAVIDAIKEVSEQGISVATYGNRSENIEVAIARAVRTGINQANGDVVMMRCAEMGTQFVKTSAHLGARVTNADDYTNHSWWQGRVFSLNWDNSVLTQYTSEIAKVEKGFEWLAQMREELAKNKEKYDYPDFIESCGYGDILGICGVNCRHSFFPFHPGIQLDDDTRPDLEENKKRYMLEQKARAMERAIRKTKREISALKESGLTSEDAKATMMQLKKLHARQNKAYREFCEENGLKVRQMALKIA